MRLFLILLFIIGGIYGLSAQALDEMILRCQYRLLYVKDTLNPKNVESDVMILEIGNKMSKFYSYDDFKSDSTLDADLKSKKSSSEMLNSHRFRIGYNTYVVYSNYPAGKITVQDKILRDFYVYEEEYPAVKWKIYPTTTNILSYSCQKAECHFRGRKYTVWFTTSIPARFGPWKLSGLPGLILKAEDEKQEFCFECFSIIKSHGTLIWNEKTCKKTDHQKFNQAYLRFRANPLMALEGMGIKIDMPNPPKKPFNPIELLNK